MKKKKRKKETDSKLNLQQIRKADATVQNLCNIYDVASTKMGSEDVSFTEDEIETSIKLACHQLLQDTHSSKQAILNQNFKVQAQRRAYEEEQLVSIGHNLNSTICANTNHRVNKCVANILWPEEPTLKMAAFQPEGAHITFRQSEQLCLLCLRFELLKCSMSCVQNAMGMNCDVISCPHHNIVNIPGEYDATDCLFPMSPHTGIVGPVVRILKHKLQLEVMHVRDQRLFRVRQLYKEVNDAVPNFR